MDNIQNTLSTPMPSLISLKAGITLNDISNNIAAFDLLLKRGNIDATCVAQYNKMKQKELEQYVAQLADEGKIDTVPWQQNRKPKNRKPYSLWVTKINGKYVTASTKEKLFTNLYTKFETEEAHVSKKAFSLEQLYKEAMIAKNHTNTEASSLSEYNRLWNKYYRNSEIAKMDVKKIGAKTWKKFFLACVEKNNLTKEQFKQIRIVANLIMKYGVTEEILPGNIIRDIDFSDLPFKDEDRSKIKSLSFTDEQITQIIRWAEEELNRPRIKPLYIFAILFNIFLGLRFAELAALKWIDINWANKTVLVSRQNVRKKMMNDDLSFENLGRQEINHLKQHVAPHPIQLPDLSIVILKEIQLLGLSNEYVFPTNGEFRYHTYNDKIKKAAKAIGLDPKDFHTHCLRATAGTTLYKYSGGDIEQVRHQLRHTNDAMSSKYVNPWWITDAAGTTMKKAIDSCLPCLPENWIKEKPQKR